VRSWWLTGYEGPVGVPVGWALCDGGCDVESAPLPEPGNFGCYGADGHWSFCIVLRAAKYGDFAGPTHLFWESDLEKRHFQISLLFFSLLFFYFSITFPPHSIIPRHCLHEMGKNLGYGVRNVFI
jgi:hypothetical protein